ncbi:phosphoribosylformylglycinamidine synthase subunit PurS [Hazenella sp. IB182357]|uniref:Phosphoribosylformylglycinamidine synthase subunit PurS n=1 Tax=Polycladospora coralii TaxID=2771432 RepID=A0A926RV35_9BACL|nr:phosphoribosylformylglycinamidine synthase subunit PurS [Polycladospora coralii]MBD1373352.1 phosphoribosylformylglycinamidine synthase subunit PurS [Polycladospora coralii]
MYKAIIDVTLKQSVLDPQGVAVKGSLHSLGYESVSDVRIGKRMEVLLESVTLAEAERDIEEICKKVLSNPVIEDFSYQLEEVA